MANLNGLMLLEREQKLPPRKIILHVQGQPDARRHFGLLHGDDAAAIKFSEDSAAEGNIAHDACFAAYHLNTGAVHPNPGGYVGEGLLKYAMGAKIRLGIKFENIARMSANHGCAEPLYAEGIFGCVNKLGAIALVLLTFRVRCLRSRVVRIRHRLQHVLQILHLAMVGGLVDGLAIFAKQDSRQSGACWHHAVDPVFEYARVGTSGAIQVMLDAFVLLEGLIVLMLIGNEEVGASTDLLGGGRRALRIEGRIVRESSACTKIRLCRTRGPRHAQTRECQDGDENGGYLEGPHCARSELRD